MYVRMDIPAMDVRAGDVFLNGIFRDYDLLETRRFGYERVLSTYEYDELTTLRTELIGRIRMSQPLAPWRKLNHEIVTVIRKS